METAACVRGLLFGDRSRFDGADVRTGECEDAWVWALGGVGEDVWADGPRFVLFRIIIFGCVAGLSPWGGSKW